MRPGLAAGLLALFTAGVSEAALPPAAQRQAELAAIAASPEVGAKLGNRPITEILSTAPDAYRVRAGACSVPVRIVDVAGPDARPGPRRFRVEAGEAECDAPEPTLAERPFHADKSGAGA